MADMDMVIETGDIKSGYIVDDTDNLLEKCTAAYHDAEHEFPIIYCKIQGNLERSNSWQCCLVFAGRKQRKIKADV